MGKPRGERDEEPRHEPDPPVGDDLHARLAGTVREKLRAEGAPGCAVALTVDRDLVFSAGIGSADLAGAVALPADAQTYAYSATKPLLATATLQLVARGQLSLDTPIQSVLPDVPLSVPVTVRQLLNHTGGVPDYGSLPEYAQAVRAHPGQAWTPDEFLAHTLAQQELLFPPGEGWAYSNIGYLLIKQLIERIRGQSLRAVLRQSLFAPLGLASTFVAEPLDDARVLTPGYSAFFEPAGELENIAPRYSPGWVSHGVVITTATELARLFDALFAGELLDLDLVAQMLSPTLVPHTHFWFQRPAYGLGLMLDAQPHFGVAAGHGGGGPGYSVGAIHCSNVRGKPVTSVALVNWDQSDAGMRIAGALIDALADAVASHLPSA